MTFIESDRHHDPCHRPQKLVKTPGFGEMLLPDFVKAIDGFTVMELQALTYFLSKDFEKEEQTLLALL